MEGAKDEAGDLIQASQAGAFGWENATALEDALRSSERLQGTVVFKSVGHALWDLAAARTAFPHDGP
jgi:ornithine cyclodeaminase